MKPATDLGNQERPDSPAGGRPAASPAGSPGGHSVVRGTVRPEHAIPWRREPGR